MLVNRYLCDAGTGNVHVEGLIVGRCAGNLNHEGSISLVTGSEVMPYRDRCYVLVEILIGKTQEE